MTQFQGAKTPSHEGPKPTAFRHPGSSARLGSRSSTNSRRPTQQLVRQQRAYLRCAQCGADPQAHVGHTDSGFMTHISLKTRRPNSHVGKRCSAVTASIEQRVWRAVLSDPAEEIVPITVERIPQQERLGDWKHFPRSWTTVSPGTHHKWASSPQTSGRISTSPTR